MRRGIVAVSIVLILVGLGAGQAGGSRTVSGYGISLAVPAGWHARVFRGAFVVSTRMPPARVPSDPTKLGVDDVIVRLYEDTSDSAWSPGLEPGTYRSGPPRPFTPRELASAGPRRSFRLSGRFFDLFVTVHRKTLSPQRLAQLNELVRSIRVRAGDFYPGRVEPASFRPARGWLVHHQGTLAVGTDNWVMTVASTVPWTDALNNAVPTASLARLRRHDGVAVFASLQADSRFPPASRSTPLRLGPVRKGYATCGPTIAGVSTRSGGGAVGSEYGYSIDVIYGRTHPTAAERALARAELARLVLPRWPRWPR